MNQLQKSVISKVLAALPGHSYAESTFYMAHDFVVSGFVVEKTPTVVRVSHNLLPLYRAASPNTMTWAEPLLGGERTLNGLNASTLSDWLQSVVGNWQRAHVERGETGLEQLISRQRFMFDSIDRSGLPVPSNLGQPRMRADYSMALLLRGDAVGSRRELVIVLAMLSYYFGLSDDRESRVIADGVVLASSWPRINAYEKSRSDEDFILGMRAYAEDFDRGSAFALACLRQTSAQQRLTYSACHGTR